MYFIGPTGGASFPKVSDVAGLNPTDYCLTDCLVPHLSRHSLMIVILDQTTWGPFWNNSYILLLGLMKRESLTSIWSDVKRTTIPLIVSGLKLWPLAHCVTYGLIPVENRLLWVDFVEILWVTILATQANGEGDSHGGVGDPDKDVEVISSSVANTSMTNTTTSDFDPVPSR